MHQPNSSIFNFNRFLIEVLLPLCIGAVALSALLNYFFETKIILGSESCGAYKINRIININDPDEIPIFGSSRAEGCYIPNLLGSDYFNYGMVATQDNVNNLMLREECKKKGKKSPLILINFDLDGINTAYGDISNYLYNSTYPPIKGFLGNKFEGYYTIPFLKYFGHFETYFKYYLNTKINLTKYTNKGGSIETITFNKEKFDHIIQEGRKTFHTFTNDPSVTAELLSIIQLNPDRFFVFIVAPYHSSFFENYSNWSAVQKFFIRLGLLPNVKVFDLSRANYPDSFFVDSHHLNYRGVVEYNKLLNDSLLSLPQALRQ